MQYILFMLIYIFHILIWLKLYEALNLPDIYISSGIHHHLNKIIRIIGKFLFESPLALGGSQIGWR